MDEIQALSQIDAALKNLSEDEQYRVMQWAANKYLQNSAPLKFAGPGLPAAVTAGVLEDAVESDVETEEQEMTQSYDTFAEILDASGANKDTERFLIAAYWLQIVNGETTWKSFEVNKLLKDTGNQIGTITTPVKTLSGAKPALVVQVSKKSGASGKGSKVLKLTSEGIKKAKAMLGQA